MTKRKLKTVEKEEKIQFWQNLWYGYWRLKDLRDGFWIFLREFWLDLNFGGYWVSKILNLVVLFLWFFFFLLFYYFSFFLFFFEVLLKSEHKLYELFINSLSHVGPILATFIIGHGIIWIFYQMVKNNLVVVL